MTAHGMLYECRVGPPKISRGGRETAQWDTVQRSKDVAIKRRPVANRKVQKTELVVF